MIVDSIQSRALVSTGQLIQTAVEDTLAVEKHYIVDRIKVRTIRRPTLRLNEVYFLLQQEVDCVSSCVLNNTQLDCYET